MSQAFDKYEKLGAYHWDWYDNPDYAWYKVCVDRCVKFCKGYTADLGGGDGFVTNKIIDNGYLAYVVDNSEEAIRLSRDNGNEHFWIEDLNDPLFYEQEKGDTCEYVCCLNVVEHLKTPEGIVNYIKHCVTKGAIIITDMPTENKGRYHEHEYTKQELLDTFKEFKPKYFVINSTEFGKPIQFHGVEIKK